MGANPPQAPAQGQAQAAVAPQAGQQPAAQQLSPQDQAAQQQAALYTQQQQAAMKAIESQKVYQAIAQVDSILAALNNSPLNKMSLGQAAASPLLGTPGAGLGTNGLNTLYSGLNTGQNSLYGAYDPTQANLLSLLGGGGGLGQSTLPYGTGAVNPYASYASALGGLF